jgi:hypothetical protein
MREQGMIGMGNNFLNGTHRAQKLEGICKWDYMKLRSFYTVKEMVARLGRWPTE